MRSMARPLRSAASPGVWRWSVGGLVLGWLVALLVFAPARWVAVAVESLTQDRVQLLETRGTVWQGSGVVVLRGGAGSRDSARLPGRLDWHLTPGLREWGLHLRASCCTPEGLSLAIQPGLQSWHVALADTRTLWPSSVLAGLGTPWNTLQFQGDMALSFRGFGVHAALDRWTLDGELLLDAMEMSSRMSTLTPLGSYRLHLQGGAQPVLHLTTLRGHLQLSGIGRWTAGRLRFEGEARSEPSYEAELANLLNIIGRRDGARSVITLG